MIINQLDDLTANQIAAGEVVERPASVVKELVENAIDAKATNIKVETEEGGIKFIRVSDNGVGMCRDDCVLCLGRHATSKIRTSEDLSAIKTLGFRGEALPSIVSVSRMKISSCDNEDNRGNFMEVKGGVIESMEEKGMTRGTVIEVSNLFYNTPARLKFLKSKSTEYSHIAGLVSEYALCYPNIRFELVKDNKATLISSAKGKLMNAAASVLGLDTAKNLVSFQAEDTGTKVYGLVSNSDYVRNNRKEEYLFVNGRSVKNRNILFAPELVFKNLLGPGKYPVCILFVECSEKLVDVNVHPTKSEVKFQNERAIYSLVYEAVRSAVMGGGGMHTISPNIPLKKTPGHLTLLEKGGGTICSANGGLSEFAPAQNKSADFVPLGDRSEGEKSQTFLGETVTDKPGQSFNSLGSGDSAVFDPFDWSGENDQSSRLSGQTILGETSEEVPVENMFVPGSSVVDLSVLKVISQYKNTYIICECSDGIVFIDQHVAHERVLYDRMIKRDYEHNFINPLLLPQNITFSNTVSSLVEERLPEFRQAGYDLAPFGQNTFIIRGVPVDIKEKDSINVLKEIAEELREFGGEGKLSVRPEQLLITASCKKAIKAGQPLSYEEMQNLVNELLKTANPFTCPHNRPIIVSLSDRELGRKFHRN
ncbi:MAG: DNA mismatch repair endonuclease MutL [Armatimonadetes bacterium]|nr:DNA mismatch repair endonuclease MutL [Candidatus Hippobium faecium]